MELLIARNPEEDKSLRYLLRLPIGPGLVFRTSGTWPRTKALYCHPMELAQWPVDAEIIERVKLKACSRRGPAIDLVADRTRESRTQFIFTMARGRQVVFWQSPRTRKQSRPNVAIPTARASGIPELEILVDAHETYPYRFSGQAARVVRRALPCGDYGVLVNSRLAASVERKSLSDLAASLTTGRLGYALGELSGLGRAAVVVEDRYSAVFKLTVVRPSVIADGLAELQVRWPGVPIVFCDNRALAEEWTYRYLAAAQVWAEAEGCQSGPLLAQPGPSSPPPAVVRAWAGANGIEVPTRGRIPKAVLAAWQEATAAIS